MKADSLAWLRLLMFLAVFQAARAQSPIQYLWSTGDTTASIAVNPAVTTTYYVTYTDGITVCTDSVTITVASPTPVDLGADTLRVCGLDSLLLDGTPGFSTYLWNSGATTQQTYSVPGWNVLTATDSTGCSSSDSVFVQLLNARLLPAEALVCSGESILLQAEDSLASLSGLGQPAYLWSTGDSTSAISVQPAVDAWYSVTLTQAGFSCSDSVLVQVRELPVVDLGPDTLSQCGVASLPLNAEAGFASYLWSTGDTTASIEVPSGFYSLVVQDEFGCQGADSILVSLLNEQILQSDTTVCAGSTITLSVGPGPLAGFVCGQSLSDVQGNSYATVELGGKCWMAENLRTSRYQDGTLINPDGLVGGNAVPYDLDVANLALYGALYSGQAVRDARGLCPLGWTVPGEADWFALADALGGNSVAGQALKSSPADTPPWDGTNSSGFSALPGGLRNTSNVFGFADSIAYFWTSTPRDLSQLWYRRIDASSNVLQRLSGSAGNGFSVRCILVEE